jgi:hypothetical protein
MYRVVKSGKFILSRFLIVYARARVFVNGRGADTTQPFQPPSPFVEKVL